MDIKFIYCNKQEDKNFISNNDILKKNFEDLYNEWNEYGLKRYGRVRVRLPHLIEKYKAYLQNDNGKLFSTVPINYSIDDIFEIHKDDMFVILIVDNQIVATLTSSDIFPDSHYIKLVRSKYKGGCTILVSKLLNSWWDSKNLKFLPINSFYDPTVKLHVDPTNEPAIGCYKKFGFKMTDESWKGEYVMILTKESYAEKYLLPLYNKKLQGRLIKYS